MKIINTRFPEIKIIEPNAFEDERGFFFESFNQKHFEEVVGHTVNFVQDNHSKSVRGVLRGLHYQLPPKAQGKLVRVIQGKVFDVAVDIRKSSSTFRQWVGEVLSSTNKKQLWIPEGFAHGFLTLSKTAELLYKTTNFYEPDLDRSIRWNDATFAINWPTAKLPLLSPKDEQAAYFENAELFS